MTYPIDNIELVQVVTTLLGSLFTARALYSCYLDMKVVNARGRFELRPMAQRRLRQQSLLLLISILLFLAGIISLFLDTGPAQSAVRGFAMVAVALVALIMSVIDHLETPRVEIMAGRRRRYSDPPNAEDNTPDDPCA